MINDTSSRYKCLRTLEYRGGDTKPRRRSSYGIAAVESHTGRIEIIPPIFVVSFTLFSPLNINGHMLSGVMAQEVTTAYNTRVLTLFYCLQISSIVFSYTSILSRIPLSLPLSLLLPFLLLLLLHLFLHRPVPPLSLPPLLSSSFFLLSLAVLSSSILFFLLVATLLAPPLCPIPIFFSFFALCVPLPPHPLRCPGAHVRIIYIVMHVIFHLFPRVRVFSVRIFSPAISALICRMYIATI